MLRAKAKVRKNITRKPTLNLSKLNFGWSREIANDMVANFQCVKCKSRIGKNLYMIAWVKEVGRPEYSVRLCKTCGDNNE